jgi:predicted RNase H-like nuclease (RuvC/YqgF family)
MSKRILVEKEVLENDIDKLKEENDKLKGYIKKYRKDIIEMSREILEMKMIIENKQKDFIEVYNQNIDFALKILNSDNKPDIVLNDIKDYLEETRI